MTCRLRTCFLASVLFAVQIYCDFSGYTDVARGVARILGFNFPENFHWPYFSVTITEFWRRWHRTLSFWIRDYVYIPLGGSRVSRGRRAFNVIVTWFLCGLWHGANWRFAAWGLFNGAFVEVSRYIHLKSVRARALAVAATFVITCFGWMLFRASSLTGGLTMMWRTLGIGHVVRGDLAGLIAGFPYCGWAILAGVAALAAVHHLTYVYNYSLEGRTASRHWRPGAFALAAGVTLTLIVLMAGSDAVFIYFAF